MIRRGGYTDEAAANVLSGTQFESLATARELEVRVRRFHTVTADGQHDTPNQRVEFRSGALTLSSVAANTQTLANGAAAAAAASVGGTVKGLSECDVIFRGQVPAGNLVLKVPGGVIWDVTSY